MIIEEVKKTDKWKELVNYYLNDWGGTGWTYEPEMAGASIPDCFTDTSHEVFNSFCYLINEEREEIQEALEETVYTKAKERYEQKKNYYR